MILLKKLTDEAGLGDPWLAEVSVDFSTDFIAGVVYGDLVLGLTR
jgi:hypothetical protein